MIQDVSSRHALASPGKHRGRGIFTVASGLSLLLYATVMGLWIRSYTICDDWSLTSASASTNIRLWDGVVVVTDGSTVVRSIEHHAVFHHLASSGGYPADNSAGARNWENVNGSDRNQFTFPLWIVAVLFAMPPLLSIGEPLARSFRRWRWKNRENGRPRQATPVFVRAESREISQIFTSRGGVLQRRTGELDRQLEAAWASARANKLQPEGVQAGSDLPIPFSIHPVVNSLRANPMSCKPSELSTTTRRTAH